MTTIDREPTHLQPVLQRGLEELKKRVKDKYEIDLGVSETLRTVERQKELVTQGLSQTMDSNHIKGLAFDMFINNYKDFGSKDIYPSSQMSQVGKEWENMGGTWGGSWKGFVDKPHCEYTAGDVMAWEWAWYDKVENTVSTDKEIKEPNQPSNFAKEAWEWAISNDITDGTNPQGMITREQVVAMIYRYHSTVE